MSWSSSPSGWEDARNDPGERVARRGRRAEWFGGLPRRSGQRAGAIRGDGSSDGEDERNGDAVFPVGLGRSAERSERTGRPTGRTLGRRWSDGEASWESARNGRRGGASESVRHCHGLPTNCALTCERPCMQHGCHAWRVALRSSERAKPSSSASPSSPCPLPSVDARITAISLRVTGRRSIAGTVASRRALALHVRNAAMRPRARARGARHTASFGVPVRNRRDR